MRSCILTAAALVAVHACFGPLWADDIDAFWEGGTGNWNVAGNWSPAGVPNNNGDIYNVFVDNEPEVAAVASLNMDATVNNVTVGSNDHLRINSYKTLTLADSGSIDNRGTLSLNASASLYRTELVVEGSALLFGGGTLTLSDHNRNIIWGSTATDRLTNEDNTIQGAGNIGGNKMGLTNQGTIVANQSTELIIDPSSSGAVNSGTFRAVGGSTLSLSAGSYQNYEGATNGLIDVGDNSIVSLSSATVTGGTVQTGANAQLRLSNSTIRGGAVTNSSTGTIRSSSETNTIGGTFTNAAGGQVIVNNYTTLKLESDPGFNNAGTFSLNGSGPLYNTGLTISGGDLGLVGGGAITMSNHSKNVITGAASTDRLINQDHLIQGAGQIGANNMGLTNRATIEANQATPLKIDPSSGGVLNTGTLRAAAGSTLQLAGGTFQNYEGATNGLIDAGDGSTLDLDSATLSGGSMQLGSNATLDLSSSTISGTPIQIGPNGQIKLNASTIRGSTLPNTSTGTVRTTGGTSTIGGTFTNPAGGQVIVNNYTTLKLESDPGFSNAGTFSLNGSGPLYNTGLTITGGDLSFVGGGAITMSNHAKNVIRGAADTDRLINQDHLIQGAGQIGANDMALTNRATIEANQTNSLTIDPSSGGVINSGTLRATGGRVRGVRDAGLRSAWHAA